MRVWPNCFTFNAKCSGVYSWALAQYARDVLLNEATNIATETTGQGKSSQQGFKLPLRQQRSKQQS